MKEALGIILSGRRVPAGEAVRLGLVDAVATAERLELSARGLLGRGRRPVRPASEPAETLARLAAEAARHNRSEEWPRQPALRKALEVVIAAAPLTMEAGLALEKAALVELAMNWRRVRVASRDFLSGGFFII